MEKYEGNGIFWKKDNPSISLAGHFSYDPEDCSTVELIGGLLGGAGTLRATPDTTTLCGATSDKKLILLFAAHAGLSVGSGLASERYKSLLVLEGADCDTLDRANFDEVEVELDLLPTWVGGPKFSFDHQPRSAKVPERIGVTLVPRLGEIASEGGLRVALESRWGQISDDLERVEITQRFVLSIAYPVERDVQDVLEDVGHVQSLITIAMDSPCRLRRVSGYRRDITRKIGTSEYPQPVEMLIRERYGRMPDQQKNPWGLIGFEAIGGLLGIVRWIQSARHFRAVIGALLSIRYMPDMFLENRFDNVIGAAEAFHRMSFDNHVQDKAEFKTQVSTIVSAVPDQYRDWLRSILRYANEPRLRHRLIQMCEMVSPVMEELVGEVELWAKVVATLRNRLTHPDDTVAFEWEPADVLYLGESVYILVASCLLVSCGVEPPTLMAMFGSPRIMNLNGQVAGAVQRLMAQVNA